MRNVYQHQSELVVIPKFEGRPDRTQTKAPGGPHAERIYQRQELAVIPKLSAMLGQKHQGFIGRFNKVSAYPSIHYETH